MSKNVLLQKIKEKDNFILTENGAVAYKSTMNALMDLFALGGADRNRPEQDKILLFKKAFEENETYALKCLFYLRDITKGQGERNFFRVVINWLAFNHPDAIKRNMQYIPMMGRWDDLYEFVDTPLEKDAFNFMREQFFLDLRSVTPSLLAKWLKSENTSSQKSRHLARKTIAAFGCTPKNYRKALSMLRKKIKVLERLMSLQQWDDIHFDKIPSRAGMIYSNAFARNDVLKQRYTAFLSNKKTKVNAATLYPCDVVKYALNAYNKEQIMAAEKYWENLTDYFQNAVFNGVAVVDTSGSMTLGRGSIAPIDVAISLGMYCAEKCNPESPWYGHYISFSRRAQLVEIEGTSFVDKVRRIKNKNLCENTNIESVFDLILNTAIANQLKDEDMPKNIVIISDMEFDFVAGHNWSDSHQKATMDQLASRFAANGYQIPHLIYWNVNSRQNNIPMQPKNGISLVSGYSPVIFEQILSGKSGYDLMLDKLNSRRYEDIQ